MGFPGSVAADADFQVETAKLQTTAVTTATLWSKVVPTNAVLKLRAEVVATKSDGSDRASYERATTVYRAAGNVTLPGAVAVPVPDYESDAAWDCTIDVDTTTQTVRLRVTGKAATTINWRARVVFEIG